jgi:hypothetical protein
MNPNLKNKTLTFGDLIASVYQACPQRRAKALVRLAVATHVITFLTPRPLTVS